MTHTRNAVNEFDAQILFLAHACGMEDFTYWHVSQIRRLLSATSGELGLQACRGSYKTSALAVSLAFLCFLEPSKNIIVFRKSQEAAAEIVYLTKRILLSDAYGALLSPCVLLKDKHTELTTQFYKNHKAKEAQLTAQGVKSANLTGMHADYIFNDDIVNIADRTSLAERERTIQILQEQTNVLNKGGLRWTQGTPWHPSDGYNYLSFAEWEKYSWRQLDFMDEKDVMARKSKLSNAIFSINYELKETPPEDCILVGAEISPITFPEGLKYAQIDPAFSRGGDYTAITALSIHDGNFYIVGRVFSAPVNEVESSLIRFLDEYKIPMCFIEDNGDHGAFSRSLIFKYRKAIDFKGYREGENKIEKISRMLSIFKHNLVFCEGTSYEYMEQITSFSPAGSAHDDAPDSLASLLIMSKATLFLQEVKNATPVS